MKSIEQLLELSQNPHYNFSPEERKVLDDFLSQNSELTNRQKSNSKTSETNIPAIVLNKNVVQKEIGYIPTTNQLVS